MASQPALQWVRMLTGSPGFLSAARRRRISRPCRADRAVDLDVLVGDSLGLLVSGGGAGGRREGAEMLAARVQSPAQVDRRRPRRCKLFMRGVERGVARILAHGEREPISRGRADQGRPAHPHVANGGRRFVNVAQRRDLELVRQPALIDDVDARAVLVEPDRAIRTPIHLHESVLLIPAPRVRGSRRRYHSQRAHGIERRPTLDLTGKRALSRS